VLNALGCGYYQLGDFATAAARLEEAVKLRPDDAGFLTNLLAAHAQILGSRRAAVEAARAKAFPPQEGDPARRFWLTMPDKQLPPPTPATSRELKALQDATAALADVEGPFDRAAGEFLGRTQPAPELQAALLLVRIEMRLRAAEALTAAGGKPEKEKAAALSAEADKKFIAAGLGKFPGDARFARMDGLRLLADGKIPEALEALKRSLARDGQQEDLRALVAAFAKPLEAVALRPVALPGKTGPVLALSSRPILGVLFRAGNSLVPPAAGKMQIFVDGRQQDGGLLGTEFLCLSDALPEGVHAVSVEGQDGLGRKASAETKILVDTAPPDIVAMDPTDGGTVTGPRPKLAFECRDRQSGLDITSIEVELRSLKGATTLLTDSPVRGGRYTFDYPQASIKKGALLPADGKVVFYPPHNLGAGPYLLTVSVGDVRGNKQTRTWKFTVAE